APLLPSARLTRLAESARPKSRTERSSARAGVACFEQLRPAMARADAATIDPLAGYASLPSETVSPASATGPSASGARPGSTSAAAPTGQPCGNAPARRGAGRGRACFGRGAVGVGAGVGVVEVVVVVDALVLVVSVVVVVSAVVSVETVVVAVVDVVVAASPATDPRRKSRPAATLIAARLSGIAGVSPQFGP